jgi:hypothetical protein
VKSPFSQSALFGLAGVVIMMVLCGFKLLLIQMIDAQLCARIGFVMKTAPLISVKEYCQIMATAQKRLNLSLLNPCSL